MSESEETEKECDSANTDEPTRCLSQGGECNQSETANVAQDLLAEIESLKDNILPVVDSLEKALEAKTKQDDPVIEGVELTFKLLQDLMSKESIQVIDPLGEPFDPNLHEAMSIVENRELESNSVFAVVQKGYTLNERLVRPAMVMVTKAPNEE